MIDLFHNGEDILLVIDPCRSVDSAVRFSEHQLQGCAVVKLHTVLDNIYQTAALAVNFGVDVIDNRFVSALLVHPAELLHCLVLCVLQKLQQQLRVHGKASVIRGVRTNTEPVILVQTFKDKFLVVLLLLKLIHSDGHLPQPLSDAFSR